MLIFYFVNSRCVDRAKNEHPILEKLIVYLARDCTGMSIYRSLVESETLYENSSWEGLACSQSQNLLLSDSQYVNVHMQQYMRPGGLSV